MVDRESVPIDARALNRATLARQLLLSREPLSVEDAVRRVYAIQAQSPPSPYLALWSRVSDLDAIEVDAAFAGGRLIKSTLMRITLHAVHVDDHATALQAVTPTLRGARFRDRRFQESGITVDQADALLPDVLGYLEGPRSNQEVEAWLAERGAGPRAWWAMRHTAPVRHAVTGPPWSFGTRPAYLATDAEMPEPGDGETAEAALAVLVRRYLEAFGPATVADVAQFAMVQRGRVRPALERLPELERLEGPGGVQLLDIPGGPRPAGDTPAPPRLLAMWDSVLLAYHDRSRILPEDLRRVVIRSNGDVLPTVLVDGHVVGVWRGVEGGGIEVTVWRDVSDGDWRGLEAEATALTDFLADRDPQPYARYRRWWTKLPPGETRVLAR